MDIIPTIPSISGSKRIREESLAAGESVSHSAGESESLAAGESVSHAAGESESLAAGESESFADGDSADPISAAQLYSKRAALLGLRRYVCHLCDTEFISGRLLNVHLLEDMDTMHTEHRKRMAANSDVSKQASIDHRAAMERVVGVARKTGIGARVIFSANGDAVTVIGRINAPDNAWQLEGGRICKFKTEGQRWRWECDTTAEVALGV
jgi:hypothetical protein